MSLEIYKKIEIESELKKLISGGMSREDATVCLVDKSNFENINYIIEACLMPIDEINSDIERYDSSNSKLDEKKFLNDLCKKYNVDRKAIIERIQTVRIINKQEQIDTPKRLQRLKNKRDLLENEKQKLFNSEKMDAEEKSVYYFGLGVVAVVSGLLFYSSLPVLVGIIPVVYAASMPVLRMSEIRKQEASLIDQLVDLDKEIEYLDTKLNEKENNEEKTFVVDNCCNCINTNLNIVESYLEQEVLVEGPKLVKRKKIRDF